MGKKLLYQSKNIGWIWKLLKKYLLKSESRYTCGTFMRKGYFWKIMIKNCDFSPNLSKFTPIRHVWTVYDTITK